MLFLENYGTSLVLQNGINKFWKRRKLTSLFFFANASITDIFHQKNMIPKLLLNEFWPRSIAIDVIALTCYSLHFSSTKLHITFYALETTQEAKSVVFFVRGKRVTLCNNCPNSYLGSWIREVFQYQLFRLTLLIKLKANGTFFFQVTVESHLWELQVIVCSPILAVRALLRLTEL